MRDPKMLERVSLAARATARPPIPREASRPEIEYHMF